MKTYIKLAIAIVISELAGIIGSLFTAPAIPTWYATLARPSFAPPNWVFAPVWTILFALMGIASFLIWQKRTDAAMRPSANKALAIFGIQLVLNILWSFIFFGMHNPGWAFVDIIALWIALLVTIVSFSKISKWAGYLLIPYIVWVSFAGVLNYSIWDLSRGAPAHATQISFSFPAELTTTYIHTVEWPPTIVRTQTPFACADTKTSNAVSYCATKESEGAAGSTYTTYTYIFPEATTTTSVTFTLRQPQCMNYDEPKQNECLDEEKSFDVDGLIIRSIK